MDVYPNPERGPVHLPGEKQVPSEAPTALRPPAPSLACRTPPDKPLRRTGVPHCAREQAGHAPQQSTLSRHQLELRSTSCILRRMLPPALPMGGTVGAPSPRASTLLWFERTQRPRLCRPGQSLPHWLHGFLTRREAEDLLRDKPQGCFLLRLSESTVSFVLSYVGANRCRHFIIEEDQTTNPACYLIAGEESRHGNLQDLLSYYTQHPVGPFEETLSGPCEDLRGGPEGAVRQQDGAADGGRVPADPGAPKQAATPPHSHVTAQYASVRRVLKKSSSLPENLLGEPTLQSGEKELHFPSCITHEDLTQPGASAQYASINKPTRPRKHTLPYINISSLTEQQGASDDTGSPPTQPGGWGGRENGSLEHVYEETPPHNQETCHQHHLYSEVNLRGLREDPSHITVPSRPVPRTLFRNLLSGTSGPPSPLFAQRGVDPLLLRSALPPHDRLPSPQQPLANKLMSRIDEQIPERPVHCKPPLPPPDPRRKLWLASSSYPADGGHK